jgi:hypothetical protein
MSTRACSGSCHAPSASRDPRSVISRRRHAGLGLYALVGGMGALAPRPPTRPAPPLRRSLTLPSQAADRACQLPPQFCF